MNIDLFTISKLRIFDTEKLLNTLTPEEKAKAFEKYATKVSLFYVKVEFKNGIYSVVDNIDFYYVCKEMDIDVMNVGIEHSQISAIIKNLEFRIRKEILNPMLCAFFYKELMDTSLQSQKDISKTVNKSQGAISNKLRLLTLPSKVQKELLRETIKERHGRAILQLQGLENYERLANEMVVKIIVHDLKVSETEDEIYLLLGKDVGTRDALHIRNVNQANPLKQPATKVIIDKVSGELEKTLEQINKYFPNLEVELTEGIDKKDFVFLLKLKGVNNGQNNGDN